MPLVAMSRAARITLAVLLVFTAPGGDVQSILGEVVDGAQLLRAFLPNR
jgi:hypothetical protein